MLSLSIDLQRGGSLSSLIAAFLDLDPEKIIHVRRLLDRIGLAHISYRLQKQKNGTEFTWLDEQGRSLRRCWLEQLSLIKHPDAIEKKSTDYDVSTTWERIDLLPQPRYRRHRRLKNRLHTLRQMLQDERYKSMSSSAAQAAQLMPDPRADPATQMLQMILQNDARKNKENAKTSRHARHTSATGMMAKGANDGDSDDISLHDSQDLADHPLRNPSQKDVSFFDIENYLRKQEIDIVVKMLILRTLQKLRESLSKVILIESANHLEQQISWQPRLSQIAACYLVAELAAVASLYVSLEIHAVHATAIPIGHFSTIWDVWLQQYAEQYVGQSSKSVFVQTYQWQKELALGVPCSDADQYQTVCEPPLLAFLTSIVKSWHHKGMYIPRRFAHGQVAADSVWISTQTTLMLYEQHFAVHHAKASSEGQKRYIQLSASLVGSHIPAQTTLRLWAESVQKLGAVQISWWNAAQWQTGMGIDSHTPSEMEPCLCLSLAIPLAVEVEVLQSLWELGVRAPISSQHADLAALALERAVVPVSGRLSGLRRQDSRAASVQVIQAHWQGRAIAIDVDAASATYAAEQLGLHIDAVRAEALWAWHARNEQ